MRRFNIVFLAVNILLLAGALYLYSAARAREHRLFNQLKPILLKTYRDFNMKLPYEDPKDMDELLAPLERGHLMRPTI
jgi:hypothetical protein